MIISTTNQKQFLQVSLQNSIKQEKLLQYQHICQQSIHGWGFSFPLPRFVLKYMNSRVASFLHMYPPQRQHIVSNQTQTSHPVCMEVVDYCFKIDRLHPTQIPISSVRLPVVAPIPATMDRYVFDEVIADNGLFTNLHNPKCVQEIEVLPPKNTLDNIACDVIAGAHHGACKLLVSYGAVGSGHGLLSHGCSIGQVPSTGLLWSILDAVGASSEWPKVACFTLERDKIRDLLHSDQNGKLLKPKTKNGLITVDTLQDDGITLLTLNYSAKQRLTQALHQKRRVLANWHAISTIIDRSEKTACPKLKNIYNQIGLNNYQVGLDVCWTTATLILLGPERDYSQILLLDLPAYSHQSTIAEYKASIELSDVQKQSAAIKNAIKFGKKDHNVARLIMGVTPTIFVPAAQRDLYVFSSVQVSDFDRQQTHSVLKLASAFDSYIDKRYFDAYKAEERRQHISGVNFTTGVQFDQTAQEVDSDINNDNHQQIKSNFQQIQNTTGKPVGHNIQVNDAVTNTFITSPSVIKAQFTNSIRAAQLFENEDFEEKTRQLQLSVQKTNIKPQISSTNSLGLPEDQATHQEQTTLQQQQQQQIQQQQQQLQQLQQQLAQQQMKQETVQQQSSFNAISTNQQVPNSAQKYDFVKSANEFDRDQNIRSLLTKMKTFLNNID